MALSNITSRKAILSAIKEFNKLGRNAFLVKYGFGRARRYFLAFDRKLYDAKAITGVAHRYEFPKKGPLKSAEFSGGERTVKRKLEELGFKVRGQGARANPVRAAKIQSRRAANDLQTPTDPLEAALKKCRKTARRGYKIAKASLQESAKAIDKATMDLSQCLQAIEGNSVRTSVISHQLQKQLSEVVNELEKLKRTSALELEERGQRLDNFSITLFGRTMAGKSTLMEILTRGDGQSIGKGGQRTTRDVRSYSWNELEITDVPGIAAFEGKDDEELAFKAASQADLVLFLITDDAPQSGEVECLARILRLGKPVLGICNVKVAVEDKDDLRLFLRNPEKSFDQTRLGQLFNQFNSFAHHQHGAGIQVPFTATHLRSQFLAQQSQIASERDQLLAASRFDRIESQIIKEVVHRGAFLRVKNFVDGAVVPMMELTDRLLEFNAQNSSGWRVMNDKRLQFQEWGQKFRTHGEARINTAISKAMTTLRQEAHSFAEEHFEDHSADECWKKLVESRGINLKMEELSKELLNERQTELNEIVRELKSELPFNATFSDTSHIKMDKIFDSKMALTWGTIAISGVLTIAAIGIASTPIGWGLGIAATATGIGGAWASGQIESGAEKRRRAREVLKQKLMEDIAKREQYFRQKLSHWFNQELLGEGVNKLLTDLDKVLSCLATLADAQCTLAWTLNDRQKALHRALVEEALVQLKTRNLKDSIVDVARVPGQGTMLLIPPDTNFPGQIRNGLEQLLGEEILFVVATKNRLSLLVQAIGQSCDRNTISIDEKLRVAHIPLDDLGPVAKARVRLAQQLTGLHLMRKEI